MVQRRFAVIGEYQGRGIPIPRRHTRNSAGYDIAAAETVQIEPGSVALVPTGLKAYMNPDEWLALYPRSSLAVKKGLIMANSVGVVDSDYADNPSDEGHIRIALYNPTKQPVVIRKGERIAQGIFQKYLTCAKDHPSDDRQGGFGSTG